MAHDAISAFLEQKLEKRGQFDSVMVDRTPPTLSTIHLGQCVLLCHFFRQNSFCSTWSHRLIGNSTHFDSRAIIFAETIKCADLLEMWQAIALSTNGAFCLSYAWFTNKGMQNISTINMHCYLSSLLLIELRHRILKFWLQ